MRSKLIKSAEFSLESYKYGINNAFLINNLNNLLLQGEIDQHKEVLVIFLKKQLSKNNDQIIGLIKSVTCYEDLNPIHSDMESCRLEVIKFLLMYATFYGSLISAEWLRSLYLNRLINEKSSNYLFAYDVALSLLEMGEIESALEFSISQKKLFFKDKMSDISCFCKYLLGDRNSYPQEQKKQNPRSKNSYFNLSLRTSSVLIKGPSSDEIDGLNDYDYVVKTNFIPDKKNNIGNHILYYNYRKFKSYSADIADLAKMAGYVCLKSDSQLKQLISSEPLSKARKFSNARPIFFRQSGSDPMAVQNITYDLIKSGVGSLFIESIDGYSSPKPYSDSYQQSDPYSEKLQKDKNIARALRMHDPFSNFSYMQNILQSGRVKGDVVVNSVFKGDRSAYAEKINSIYGNMYVY